MTRGNYELIAAAILTAPFHDSLVPRRSGETTRLMVAHHFADVLASVDEHFKRDLFIKNATRRDA